jgi:4-amino-4-deoxy-L-arabinose transferase-like glycosyltransferase
MKTSNKHIYIFIIIVAIIKIFFSFFIELGNDESYYYTYALQPQLNYFDHPPLVGFLIRLTTLNLTFVNDVLLRLGAIICCAIASVLIYQIATKLHNEIAGWYAVLIYNFSIYTGIIAGFFILPDSLQMPFWCAALWLMCHLIVNNNDKKISTWFWLGLAIGLACLCKIHSLYLWVGFGLYILFYKTKWLLNWRLYCSVLISIICLLPILIWNINNHFITYQFHSQRVANTSIQWHSLLQEIVGEMLYQNPVIWILIVVALFQKYKHKTLNLQLQTPNKFLIFLSLPMIFFFWSLSLLNDILPHWSGPAFIPLYIFAAIYLAKKTNKKMPVTLTIAGFLLFSVMMIATIIIHFYPSNFGSKDKGNFGENCPTLDISGWQHFSADFNEIYTQDTTTKQIKNPVILINKWFPACQLQFYTATKTHLPIVAIGTVQDVHQFAWLNKQTKPLTIGNDAYCIVPSNQPTDVVAAYSQYFTTIEKPQIMNQIRGGKIVRYFYIWRLKNCKQIPADFIF